MLNFLYTAGGESFMEQRKLNCPNCGADFPIPADAVSISCPYCGSSVEVPQAGAVLPESVTVQFTDSAKGIPLGSAKVPQGWNVQGLYSEVQIDEITPFGTTFLSSDPVHNCQLASRYGERFYEMKSSSTLLGMGIPKNLRRPYMDPVTYLFTLAGAVVNAPITRSSHGPIETVYSRNRQNEAQKIISRFNDNARIVLPDVQCDLKIQDLLCESHAVSGTFEQNGQPFVIYFGADLYGLEYYDAAPMSSLARGIGNVLSGSSNGSVWNRSMEAMRSGEEKFLSKEFFKGGGLVGVMQRQKAKMAEEQAQAQRSGKPAGFGHSKEAGKPVDVIEWGCKRMYWAVGPLAYADALLKVFLDYTASCQMAPALVQQLEQIHQQVRMQEQAQLNGTMAYAMNSRAINMQRQADISRTLSQTSDIIMEGYNNRSAAMDRISQKTSEAIRGVNTFQTTDGRTVEHSVTADHVYQNQSGSTVGVSGSALDETTLRDLGLTELHRK